MKNIWKERWDNCDRRYLNQTFTRFQDKWSSLANAVYTRGLEPLRRDAEVEITEVSTDVFEIRFEAPHSDDLCLKGFVVKSLIKVTKKNGAEYIKLVDVKKFHPHTDNPALDYYNTVSWDKRVKVIDGSFFRRAIDDLRNRTRSYYVYEN